MGELKGLVALTVIAVSVVSSWILTLRMRRRLRRSLGVQPANESELTSLSTWMKVDQIEREREGRKPIEPR